MKSLVNPAFKDCNSVIVFESSEEYAPYMSVTLQSVINNTTAKYNYDIVILTLNISKESEKRLIDQADGKDNISIRVINCKNELIELTGTSEDKYGGAALMRLCLPELLNEYRFALHIDSDMIVDADVADILYGNVIDGHCLAAVNDIYGYISYHSPDAPGKYFSKDRVENVLQLSDISDYINGGFVLYDLPELRNKLPLDKLLDYALDEKCKFKDQDAFSHFLPDSTVKLKMEWNWVTGSDDFIAKYQKYLRQGDAVLADYIESEKNIKVFHYASAAKPWDHPDTPYAEKWWNVAYKTPFFDKFFEKINDYVTPSINYCKRTNNRNRLLFICETYYNLINALNIKYHYYRECPADLIITSSTNLLKYKEKIETIGLWENVWHTEYNAAVDIEKIRNSDVKKLTLHPEEYELIVNLDKTYSDYFMNCAASPYQKMIYYSLVHNGLIPRVHIYEDGSENYVENIGSSVERDSIKHDLYPQEQRFLYNVSNVYLYKPSLYCGDSKTRTMLIPQVKESDTGFINILRSVFGESQLPKERYIFFNECFYEDFRVSNEIEILNCIAETVGKENIIVKPHPRSLMADTIYRINGYKVFDDNSVPWEIFALDPKMNGKVLMSISSIAPATTYTLFNKSFFTIYLNKIMTLSRRTHASRPFFIKFLDKLKKMINRTDKWIFFPRTITELNYVLEYIEEEL